MPRFALHREASLDLYLLDVQADLVARLDTRMIVPMVPPHRAAPVGKWLNPTFLIGGEPFVMMTQQMAAVPVWDLGAEAGSLRHEADAITRALDMLFTGF